MIGAGVWLKGSTQTNARFMLPRIPGLTRNNLLLASPITGEKVSTVEQIRRKEKKK